jgi:hypothetical protein
VKTFVGLMLCALSCAVNHSSRAQSAGGAQRAWSSEDRDAAGYALAKAATDRTITINLSDSKMARFLKRHYEISGFTADRYPGLHKLMADQAGIHAAQGVAGARVRELSGDLVYEDLATLMLGLYPTSTTQTYTAYGVASMEAPQADPTRALQIAYASLCFYDLNNDPIGDCTPQSSFGSGQYFPISNSLSGAPAAFQGALSVTYYDVTNKRYVAQMSTLSADKIEYPSSQTITDPVILNKDNKPLAAALVCTSRTVNANANPGICDYGTYATNNVLVKMSGSVTYASTQAPKLDSAGHIVGTGSVALINTTQGGQCRLSASISGNKFFSQPQVTYTAATKTLAWNFASLDFGPATNLICGGNGANIQFSLLLQVTDTDGDPNPIVAAQYSKAGTTTPILAPGPNAGALLTPMLRLVAGCLHPDTEISLAGAATQPIAKFTGEGERIRAKDGAEGRVTGTVNGKDEWLFVIRAENGFEVKATAQHPFVAPDGTWKAAQDLRAGESVLTAQGAAKITEVRKIAYNGPVHNLVLAHPPEDFTLENETFYANGFLVGGHDAQQRLAATTKAAPPRVSALLPDDFKVDYESHLKAQAKQ